MIKKEKKKKKDKKTKAALESAGEPGDRVCISTFRILGLAQSLERKELLRWHCPVFLECLCPPPPPWDGQSQALAFYSNCS